MQKIFRLHDGDLQKVGDLEKMLYDGWKVISTVKINYGNTTLFILEKK